MDKSEDCHGDLKTRKLKRDCTCVVISIAAYRASSSGWLICILSYSRALL